MTKALRRTLVLAGSALALSAAALALHAKEASASLQPEAKLVAAPAVQLARVEAVRTTPHEEIVGSLSPAKALQLGFEVGGRLARVSALRGGKVSQGQVVGQLDLELVSAQVAQAEGALSAAQAQAGLARDTARRQGQLQQGGSVSEWQSKSSDSQAQAAEAQVRVAKAALAQARALRSKHTLRAPFAATVIEAPDQSGNNVAVGAPLYTLEDLDTLTLKISLPESAREALRPGARVHVLAVGGSAQTDDARIRAIIPSADAATRRLPVEISVPNRDHRFLAHTLARAVLPLGDEQAASSLPSTALASAGGDHVFVVEGAAVKKVMVTVLDRGAAQVVVQGLPANSRVIDSPALDLQDGARVEVKQ